MKILHFDYDDLNNIYAGGGQAKATKELYRRFKLKHEITVITGAAPGLFDTQIDNIKYKRLGISNLGSSVSILSFWALLPIYAAFHQHKYDVIVEYFTAPFAASLLPYVARIPLIGCPTFFHSEKLSNKYRIPFHLVREFLIKKYRFFITLTAFMKNQIQSDNPQAIIRIFPRGIEKEILESNTVDGTYGLFLGRIDIFNKGLDMLIAAWQKIIKKGIPVKLIIAGTGKKTDLIRLTRLVNEKKLTKWVVLVGKVQGKQKIDLITRSRFVICPSRFETFSNVALEAIAAKKALISFNISGLSWIPNGLSVKINAFDVEELSHEIIELNKNKSLRLSLGGRARKFANKFNWDVIAKDYEQYLMKIIKKYHE